VMSINPAQIVTVAMAAIRPKPRVCKIAVITYPYRVKATAQLSPSGRYSARPMLMSPAPQAAKNSPQARPQPLLSDLLQSAASFPAKTIACSANTISAHAAFALVKLETKHARKAPKCPSQKPIYHSAQNIAQGGDNYKRGNRFLFRSHQSR